MTIAIQPCPIAIYMYMYIDIDIYIYINEPFVERQLETTFAEQNNYGVATISRLLEIIRLFCRISSLL